MRAKRVHEPGITSCPLSIEYACSWACQGCNARQRLGATGKPARPHIYIKPLFLPLLLSFLSNTLHFLGLQKLSEKRKKMSSTASGVHSLNIRDTGACARIDIWDGQTCPGMIGIEAKSSSSSKPGRHDTGTDSPPASPTRAADATPALCLPSSARVTDDDTSAKAVQRDLRRTRTAQLQSIYGLWSTCTCTCDVGDVRIPLPTTRCLDGDIFGVGKRPVQHEIEADGCVRLVFVEVDEIVD